MPKLKPASNVKININPNLNVRMKNTKIDLSILVFSFLTIFTMLADEVKKLLTNSSHIPRILLMGFKGRGLLAAHYIESGWQKLCEGEKFGLRRKS